MDYILEIKDLYKSFENKKVLSGINIKIPKGKIFGLLGPNGAGKTTLIRIINRIFFQDKGEIFFNNKPIDYKDVIKIGYLPEERGLYSKMTVWDQGLYFATLKGLTLKQAKQRLEELLSEFDILSWANKKIQELSKGMQQKIQFIYTLLHNPDLLILDEPFSGLDPINTEIIKTKIIALNKKGKTIIFSTHNMPSVEDLCDKIALINKGKVIIEGYIDKVKQNFDRGEYKLTFYKDIQLAENQYFKILKKEQKANKTIYYIQILTNKKEFLHQLTNYPDIEEFKHNLPSLHEIFIKVVQDTQENENPVFLNN